MKRYLVLMMRRAGVDPAVVTQHRAYLDQLRAAGRNELSGPFGDHGGGAWLLRASDMAEARAIVAADPASSSGGWDITLHEWLAD